LIPHPPEIELEDIPCPLGCNAGDKIVLIGRDRIHNLPGEYPVVKCLDCGLLRTNPRPTMKTIHYYYPDDYGPYLGTMVHPESGRTTPLPEWKKMVLPLFQWNTERLPYLPPGRLLEIGCASGGFLHRMARQGWLVEGVEPSRKASEATRALGYDVFTGPIEATPERESTFDLIVGWMVLEHLHDPIRSLQKLSRLVKPGGFLVISVPNAGSMEFRVFKEKWYALQLPAHLFHFTPRTISMVLDKGGWRVQRIFHQRVMSNLIASIGYVLKDHGYSNRITSPLINYPDMAGRKLYLMYPFAYFMSLFGQTGRMTVWARRKLD
jgi:2-polyprenyl-3-methyl-5-hydroxy-6-metoxy-1,4-benzoquinol methylase